MTVEYPDIAVIGKAGAGKTTIAEILEGLGGYTRYSFAEPLKDVASMLWGEEARTDRDKLQRLGVAVRQIVTDTWVDLLAEELDHASAPAVIDDCRFPNEHEVLRQRGFKFIRVWADEPTRIARLTAIGKLTDPRQLEHESETALDWAYPDLTLYNDGDIPKLGEQVADYLNKVAR